MNLEPNDNPKSNPYADVPKIKLFQRMIHFGVLGGGGGGCCGCGTYIQNQFYEASVAKTCAGAPLEVHLLRWPHSHEEPHDHHIFADGF